MFEKISNKRFLVLVLSIGVMLFFIGMASYIALGPSNEGYILPQQVSSIFKLTGMALVCIALIITGFFLEDIDRETKLLLLIIGVVFLLLNIFIFPYSR